MIQPRVIFVDDEKHILDAIDVNLDLLFGASRAFNVEFYLNPDEAVAAIRRNPFDVALVFLDHHISAEKGVFGSSFIKDIKKISSHIEVVMMSSDNTSEALKMWLDSGADKYVIKDAESQYQKIPIFVSEALTKFRAKFGSLLDSRSRKVSAVPQKLKQIGLISVAPALSTIADLILQSADSDLSVLIFGDTGTGKELLARAIHSNSKRKNNEFRTIDCTQFKRSELIASELFGSEKGAFTGAENKMGLLEVANGGTIFLDEVHHLPADAQAMLLRFLQDRKVRRVGGKVEKFVDVRLVFAAKPTLKEMVKSQEFLVDLLYRMKEIRIDIPSLIERPEDLEVLCEYFLEKYQRSEVDSLPKQLHPDVVTMLRKYKWPGNVRELENLVKRLSVLVNGPLILPEHIQKFGELDVDFNELAGPPVSEDLVGLNNRHQKEARALILTAYQQCDHNLSETARRLGIPRSSLRSQCQALGIWETMDLKSSDQQTESKAEMRKRINRSIQGVMRLVSEN